MCKSAKSVCVERERERERNAGAGRIFRTDSMSVDGSVRGVVEHNVMGGRLKIAYSSDWNRTKMRS